MTILHHRIITEGEHDTGGNDKVLQVTFDEKEKSFHVLTVRRTGYTSPD